MHIIFKFGLDKALALKISRGLEVGMGRLGEACGAVTGAYLVISLKHGKVSQDDNDSKETTYKLVQEFSGKFIKRNKSTNCKDILGVDLLTDNKDFAAKQVKLLCSQMIQDSAEILEDILDI